MSGTQKILQAFKHTVMGSSTQEVKNAENLLKEFEQNENFLSHIKLILEEATVEMLLQKAAAVYINKYATNVLKSRNQQKINLTAEGLLTLLSSYKIDFNNKIHICKALETMLATDHNKVIRAAFQPNLIGLVKNTQSQSDDQINFEFLVFFGQILMHNPGFTEQVWKFISATFICYLKLTIRVQGLLEQALSTKNRQMVSKLLLLTREYLYLSKIYLKRFLFVDLQSNKFLFVTQLQNIISKAFQIKLPNNLLSNSLFYLVESPAQEEKVFNQIKENGLSLLNVLLKTLLSVIKEPKLLQLNPVYQKIPKYLKYMVESTQQLMRRQTYYKLKDMCLLRALDEVYGFLITATRANTFYNFFIESKQKIIQDLLFRALSLTPNDYQNYYQNPQQFINNLIHIIQRDIKIKTRQTNQQQQKDQIQYFDTLRTTAAQLLNTFCKYQDGTLSQIMQYAFLILDGKVNSEFSPTLMLVVIAVLRDVTAERKDLHLSVNAVIVRMLTEMEIPRKSTEEPESNTSHKQVDVQYALVLLLLSKYYVKLQKVNPKIIEFSFQLCHKILNDPKVEEVPNLLALDIIEVINHLQQGQPYSPEILRTFNRLLTNMQRPYVKLLQAYFSLIRYNDVQLRMKSYQDLVEMINLMAVHINRQIQNPNLQQILINKMWNIIRQVGQNSQFIPSMIQPIENAIMPLLPYIDGNNKFDFEEDILMLMTAFIGKSESVTQNQLKMFQIIPKIFYTQYKAIFGHSFETLQTFIYYGKDILKSSPAAINSIVQMGLTSIMNSQYKGRQLSQADNCEGVLLLQSLLIACGLSMQKKIFEQIADKCVKRLQNPLKFKLLKSNLVALLALVLVHGCQFFQSDISDHLLSVILNNISCFEGVKHSPKMLIIALNKLLSKYHLEFIRRRFVQIFDINITLLQTITMKKNNLFDGDDDVDEERDYQNSLYQTVNQVIKMDQFQDFKNQIKSLKEQNITLLQNTVNELPQSKKDFFKSILTVERVSNQPRKIFTIRRNK